MFHSQTAQVLPGSTAHLAPAEPSAPENYNKVGEIYERS